LLVKRLWERGRIELDFAVAELFKVRFGAFDNLLAVDAHDFGVTELRVPDRQVERD
jgi:hypothetical protein